MEKTVFDFWKRWHMADELDRMSLIQTLTLPSNKIDDDDIYKHTCAVIINSYLSDLAEYFDDKMGK